jgi:hypothetical protein
MGGGVREQPASEKRAQLGAAGAAAGLGCSVVVSLLVFIGGGILLDGALETTPILTLIGVVIGLIAAGYQLYELTRIGVAGREPGPLGRRLTRGTAGRRAPAAGTGREE